MECKQCEDRGADRWEMQYRSGARVIVYLCQECAEETRDRDDVTELLPADK
jgi:protein-arginine kinase activator protein McsA